MSSSGERQNHGVLAAGSLSKVWFASALGKLIPKKDNETNTVEELAEKPTGKWVKWRTLILRCRAVDPPCKSSVRVRSLEWMFFTLALSTLQPRARLRAVVVGYQVCNGNEAGSGR